MRNRLVPSMFRTGGRLLRFNRRQAAYKGKPLPALVTHESCSRAVAILREQAERGRLNARALVVRDLSRVPK